MASIASIAAIYARRSPDSTDHSLAGRCDLVSQGVRADQSPKAQGVNEFHLRFFLGLSDVETIP